MRLRGERRWAVGSALLLLGCGHSPPRVLVRPLPVACLGAVGTPEEVAQTPRADRELEGLALSITSGVVADEAIYRRVLRDVPQIRARFPEMAAIPYVGPYADRLVFSVDPETARAIKEHRYHAWDCLNAYYAVRETELFNADRVAVRFGGVYALMLVGAVYAKLPGVRPVPAEAPTWETPRRLTASLLEGVATYTFSTADDCPAGCINRRETRFRVDAAGTITPLGTRWLSGL